MDLTYITSTPSQSTTKMTINHFVPVFLIKLQGQKQREGDGNKIVC